MYNEAGGKWDSGRGKGWVGKVLQEVTLKFIKWIEEAMRPTWMSTSEPFARSTYFHIFVAASFTGYTLPFSLIPIPSLQFSFDIIFWVVGERSLTLRLSWVALCIFYGVLNVLLEMVLLTWTISVSLLVFCFHLWIPSLFLLCKSLHHVPFLVQCAITINTLLCLQNKRIGKNKAGYPYWVLSSIWQDINRDNLDSNIM